MEEALQKAIIVLVKQITQITNPDEALKLTQAALNVAHTIMVIKTDTN